MAYSLAFGTDRNNIDWLMLVSRIINRLPGPRRMSPSLRRCDRRSPRCRPSRSRPSPAARPISTPRARVFRSSRACAYASRRGFHPGEHSEHAPPPPSINIVYPGQGGQESISAVSTMLASVHVHKILRGATRCQRKALCSAAVEQRSARRGGQKELYVHVRPLFCLSPRARALGPKMTRCQSMSGGFVRGSAQAREPSGQQGASGRLLAAGGCRSTRLAPSRRSPKPRPERTIPARHM